MERSSLESLFRSLEREGARYLVAGGLAVLAHGYLRLTLDVDLILDLEPPHPGPALRALESLSFRPLVPVALEDYADATKRRTWSFEKDAKVFPLVSERFRDLRVDLFIDPPVVFAEALDRALRAAIAPGVEVWFVGFEDLVEMKRSAGRPQDLADIDRLLRIRSGSGEP